MRIVFINLHTDWMLVKASSVLIFKNSAAIKHGYLLQYLLDHPEYEIATCLNDRSFSIFTHGSNAMQKVLNLFSPLESNWVFKKNGIDPKRITRLKSLKEIRKDDIVILYNIMSDEYRHLENVDAFKALGMVHFHGFEGEVDKMKKAGIDCFFNEADLSKSCKLFQKYYPIDKPWITLPFVFAERFKPIRPFSERKNKAASIGTIAYKEHKEFLEVYGDSCDQPIREAVKKNPEFFKDTVDCYNYAYNEDDNLKKWKETDNPISKLYKRTYNRLTSGRQKTYFSFDMVEKFNEYKMHVVGEEVLGFPGIGYVEGMACGSAYIGLDSPMYRDLGLIPGVHYIAYDGTKEGLRTTVEYWQRPENQAELERIAATGCAFVRENFRGPKVAERLIADLQRLQNDWRRSKS